MGYNSVTDNCRLLTQSLSYLQPIVALLYTDFDVLGFHRTASAQKQTTTDINNCIGLALFNDS